MPYFTPLLQKAASGDRHAGDELYRIIYSDLRQIAEVYLRGERPGHTLQPTALVNEVYLRLLGGAEQKDDHQWTGRNAFYAAAAKAMRNILVDSARRKQSVKRGGGRPAAQINLDQISVADAAEEVLALNDALDALAAVEPVVAELVTLRYFGGLTNNEAAEMLGISPRTATTHWAFARSWLLEAIDPLPK